MDINLKEFFTTGNLGLIKLGLSIKEIIELLGDPDDYGIHKKRADYKYGNLQIGFYEGTVSFLGLYYDRWSERTNTLSFIGFEPDSKTSFDVFTTYLSDQRIPSSINNLVTFDDQLALEIGLGVSAYFRGVTKLLDSIQYIGPKTPIKQKANKRVL